MGRLTLSASVVCLLAAAWVRADDAPLLSRLTKAGATIDRDESKPGKPVRQISMNVLQVTDDVNQALKDLEEIPAVELIGAGATEIPIATLRALQGKQSLKRLSLSYAKVSDESARVLGTLKSLTTLDLRVQDEFSPHGLEEIFKLTNLKELTLSDRLVNEYSFEDLAKLTGLKTLNIRSVFVTDNGLASLKRLKSLQTLRISLGKDVTAAGVGHLARIPLKRLEVTCFNASDKELKELRTAPALTTLRLMNAAGVTKAAIPYLSEMTELKELEIFGSRLTKDQIKELKASLPECKITERDQ